MSIPPRKSGNDEDGIMRSTAKPLSLIKNDTMPPTEKSGEHTIGSTWRSTERAFCGEESTPRSDKKGADYVL